MSGRIITFYSFKGGTGRSMALANVAWILASRGKRVLAVDWDLEAPGLHWYFHPMLRDKKLTSRPGGVIDYLTAFADAATSPEFGQVSDDTWHKAYTNLGRYAMAVDWDFTPPGRLEFVSAGLQDAGFAARVSSFDWDAFYSRLGGGVLLESLRERLRDEYDYVLIDSRTGFSDTAGICTVHLPDIVVICMTLNKQSTDGSAGVVQSILRSRQAEATKIYPVPMRVEYAETPSLERGRLYARKRFARIPGCPPVDDIDRYWLAVEVPHRPAYAHEETLAVLRDDPTDYNAISRAFERMTAYLTNGAVDSVAPPLDSAREAYLRQFESNADSYMTKETTELEQTPKAAKSLSEALDGRTKTCYISSTFLDNRERRKVVEGAIIRAGLVPVGMEHFAATAIPPVQECVRRVMESDLFIGILGRRYGWIPEGQADSIIEIEYKAARQAGKPTLLFLRDSSSPLSVDDMDPGPERWSKQERLEQFTKRVLQDSMCSTFTDESLGLKIFHSLVNWRETLVQEHENQINKYLRNLESMHSALPIAGFVTKLRVPIDLADLYVPLRAVADLRSVGGAAFADAKAAEDCFEEIRERQELSLPDAFTACENIGRRGLVILGDPGAGKTTHLKRVMLTCCRHGAPSLGLPKGMVPVFLPLQDLKDPKAGLATFIQAQLDKNMELGTDIDFGKRLLERSNLLILLDGLDAVINEADRQQVSRWIEMALKSHPECRFVITCRYAGYSEAVRLDAHFLELHIRPLSDDQVATFVHNWYRIVELGINVDKAQAEAIALKQADKLVARLRAPDFQARRVYELTANPLLLANLCLVHRDRGELPKRRAQLYSECVDVLLERWRSAKNLPLQVTADEGRRVLQPAALFMHETENRTRVSAVDLAPVIAPSLRNIQWQGGGASDFLKMIRDESGLLTGWGDGTYGFIHLGFQEYFAAREIRVRYLSGNHDVVVDLAKKFGESWWREVILLLMALEEPSLFEPFMREVVKTKSFVEHPDLVEACLDESFQISKVPFVELLQQPQTGDSKFQQRRQLAQRIVKSRFREDDG